MFIPNKKSDFFFANLKKSLLKNNFWGKMASFPDKSRFLWALQRGLAILCAFPPRRFRKESAFVLQKEGHRFRKGRASFSKRKGVVSERAGQWAKKRSGFAGWEARSLYIIMCMGGEAVLRSRAKTLRWAMVVFASEAVVSAARQGLSLARSLPRRGHFFSLGSFLMSHSPICTALSAAPFLIWSPESQRVRPFSLARSLRMRPT